MIHEDSCRRPRGLTHPLFWSALAVLVLNDHLLKGAGVLPGAVTGKLSDFAGLIVAPVLLAALLAPISRAASRAAVIAPLLVGAGLAAIKLDASLAHAAELAFRALGVPARIWVDPTDLWALSVLPLASLLCRPASPSNARGSRTSLSPAVRRATQRVGIAAAALACVATVGGGDDDKSSTSGDAPQLSNDTEATLIVNIATTDGAGGCRIYRQDRVGVLTPDAFLARREVVMGPGDRESLVGSPDADFSCGAAWIALPDGSEVLLYWRDLEELDAFVSDDDEGRVARRVVLRGEDNRYRFELGDALSRLELEEVPPDGTCVGDDPEHSVEFTPLATAPGFLELGERTRDEDGCLVVEWFAQQGDTEPDMQRLCIPDWALPFEEGEALSVVETVLEDGERQLRITRYDENRLDQQLTIWNHGSTLEGSHIAAVVGADCIGDLSECGAYVRPVEVELPDDDGVLVSGDEADISDGSDDIRMLLGAGLDVGWTGATCTGVEARVGLSVNLLELRTD